MALRSVALGLLLLITVPTVLRADHAAPPGAPDDAVAQVPGHSLHGEAYNEGPRQAAYLMAGMPKVQFAVSTTNALAQQFFTQGVGQLHGFWYFEAERSFRQAAVLDTNCAMAFWGLAMANINNTNRAGVFIETARKLRDGASHREQLWVDALAEYYREPLKDAKERRRDYIRALENIVFEFPEDVEAKAFLAFTIWESAGDGIAIGSAQAVESLLKEVFAAQPMHPAHHYRIHLWDGEKDPSSIRALPSAARCGQSGPGIAHLWHMPGHTFNKLKRYGDMAWQQEASVRVDNAQVMRDGILPDQIHNYAHNSEWLIQTLNYVGRVRDALALARNMIEMPQHPRYNAIGLTNNGAPYRDRVYDTSNQGRLRMMETLLRYELWDEALALSDTFYLEPTVRGLEQSRRARLMGVAQFARGRTNEGRSQMESIDSAARVLRAERAAVMDAEEARARTEKKSDDEVKKAMTSALDRYDQPLKRLVEWIAELRVLDALPTATLDGLTNDVVALKSVSKERLSLIWLHLGATNQADTLAREAVEGGTNQVQLLANQADVLWRLGRTNDALAAFERLRVLSADLDREMPVFRRLQPLVAHLGLAEDWRAAAEPRDDTGERPKLATLGPYLWKPAQAPDFNLVGADGKRVTLADYRGRPLLLFFYLGHGCVHCLEQLNALAPAAPEFASAGISMLAVSADSPDALGRTQSKARASGGFPFPIVSDADRSVFKAYRAFDDFENVPLHGVFLLDGEGRIRWQDIGYEPFTDVPFLLTEARRQLRQQTDGAQLTRNGFSTERE
jgi:peroxiredoxin